MLSWPQRPGTGSEVYRGGACVGYVNFELPASNNAFPKVSVSMSLFCSWQIHIIRSCTES